MSSQDVKQVSIPTGTFQALSGRAEPVSPSGKITPDTGKQAPVETLEEAKGQPDIEAMTARLNVASQSIGRDLRFKVDMDSGSSVIQVLDRDTGEVIRQIPPEKARLYVSESGAMALRLYDAQV